MFFIVLYLHRYDFTELIVSHFTQLKLQTITFQRSSSSSQVKERMQTYSVPKGMTLFFSPGSKLRLFCSFAFIIELFCHHNYLYRFYKRLTACQRYFNIVSVRFIDAILYLSFSLHCTATARDMSIYTHAQCTTEQHFQTIFNGVFSF